ncbi:MAG: Sec-independent protein translocase protein TatB [Acidimicrobiia bacterium]
MFNVGGSEFLMIALVALLVLGPERMPDVVRKAGKIVGELRRMSNGFQAELKDAFAEPIQTMNEVKGQMNSTVTDLRSAISSAANVTIDAPVPATKDEPVAESQAVAGPTSSPWGAPDPTAVTQLPPPDTDRQNAEP